jgi:preprotein translocase subunit YajC|tara:strand:+ start:1372 stop:1545 length:174 start_codon:yes stop_codon:yes gene_type:complete
MGMEVMGTMSDFLDFLLVVLSFLGTLYFLFLRPAYQRKVQKKTWGEILGHDEGIDET